MKKADMPGWGKLLALALALFLLIFLIWLAVKSGKTSVELFQGIP